MCGAGTISVSGPPKEGLDWVLNSKFSDCNGASSPAVRTTSGRDEVGPCFLCALRSGMGNSLANANSSIAR